MTPLAPDIASIANLVKLEASSPTGLVWLSNRNAKARAGMQAGYRHKASATWRVWIGGKSLNCNIVVALLKGAEQHISQSQEK